MNLMKIHLGMALRKEIHFKKKQNKCACYLKQYKKFDELDENTSGYGTAEGNTFQEETKQMRMLPKTIQKI